MKSTGSQEQSNIDRGWAWMIVVGVFIEVFCLIGISKSMGLIVMELVRQFDISIAEAVLPATVVFTTYALASPAGLILGEMFSVRKVVIFGSVCGFVGMSLASLLYNVTYFTIFYGASIGLGGACFYGNGLLLLGRYFRRHRSVANGLSLAGASIGQFVMPPVIEYLLENYGLGGTTLISAAIFLHGAVSGSLFRSLDPSEIQVSRDADQVKENTGEQGIIVNEQENVTQDKDQEFHALLSIGGQQEDTQVQSNAGGMDTDTQQVNLQQNGKAKSEVIQSSENDSAVLLSDTTPLKTPMTSDQKMMTSNTDFDNNTTHVDNQGDTETESERIMTDHAETSKAQNFMQRLRQTLDFRVLRSYITVFYTVVSLLCFFGYMNIVLFLPPVFREMGLERRDRANLISVSGAGELVARVGMGFLADRNFIPRYKIMGAACCVCGLNIFMLHFADTFMWAAIHSFFYGFTGGTYICLGVVVLVDFVGLGELSRNLVIILFIQGVGAALGQPALGALRDSTGSCDIIIFLCSSSTFLGGLLLFAYPLVQRWEKNRLGRINGINA